VNRKTYHMVTAIDLTAALEAAKEVALAAGKIIRDAFDRPITIMAKDADAVDLVTETDKACEALIFQTLAAKVPGTAFLGEESAAGNRPLVSAMLDASKDTYTWVIDPLDGTSNFCSHYPHSNVSIGLVLDRKPVLGVIYDPFREDLFWAVKGQGAYRNGSRIEAFQHVTTVKQALVATNIPADRSEATVLKVNHLIATLMRVPVRGIRMHASCALDMCYIACGELAAYVEDGPWPWDMAAGWIIMSEAGAVISNTNGSDFSLDSGGLMAACTPELLADLKRVLLP
jgi:inositol-phosphate phosphatase/L-galactose 1-phosphate phosphatase